MMKNLWEEWKICTVILGKEKEENSSRAETRCGHGWSAEWGNVESQFF